MKKLLSLCLALCLTLSLTAPVSALGATPAAPPPEPQPTSLPANVTDAEFGWQHEGFASLDEAISAYDESGYYSYHAMPAEQDAWIAAYAAAHPEAANAFDVDAYFAKAFPDYASKEEYMDDYDIAEAAAFERAMRLNWTDKQMAVTTAQAQWAALVAADPAATATFLAELPALILSGGDADLASFMEYRGYTVLEQVYMGLYDYWQSDRADKLAALTARNERITAIGGEIGQINVMLDAKCLTFGANKPKISGGVLLAPVAALGKSFGTPVADAEGYTPLRAAAEAAGLDLFWDADYRMAVVLDKQKILDETAKEFSQLDALFTRMMALAVPANDGKTHKISENASMTLTMLNSLDGDKTYKAVLTQDTTMKDGAFSAKLNLNVAGLMELLTPELRALLLEQMPNKKLSFSALTQLVSGVKIELLYNPDDAIYVKAPILAEFIAGYEANAWLKFDMGALGSTSYLLTGMTGLDMGLSASKDAPTSVSALIAGMLYAQGVASRVYYGDKTEIYDNIMAQREVASLFVGNARFTENNGTLTYALTTKDLNAAMLLAVSQTAGAMNAEARAALEGKTDKAEQGFFRTGELALNITSAGALTMKIDLRPDMDYIARMSTGMFGGSSVVMQFFLTQVFSLLDFRYEVSANLGATQSTSTLNFHWKNQLKLAFDAKSTTSTLGANAPAPVFTPPEGAATMTWDEFAALLSF